MKALTVTQEYKEKFLFADATFKHQIVYDPFLTQLTPLRSLDPNSEHCIIAGQMFDNEQAYQLALGNLDPLTMARIDNWNPNTSIISQYSIWSPRFIPRPVKIPIVVPQTPKSNTPDVQDIENAKIRHDEQVEKELQFYKVSPTTPLAVKVDNRPAHSPQEELSPVLGNNPFLKKISKFQATITSDQKVISRYFQKSQGRVFEFKCLSVSTLPTVNEDDEDFKPSPHTSTRTGSLGCDTNFVSGVEGVSGSQKSEMDENPMADDWPAVECECILQVDEGELAFPSTSAVVQGDNRKKRKLEGYRNPAPKKNKKQQTIQSMFMRMNMNFD